MRPCCGAEPCGLLPCCTQVSLDGGPFSPDSSVPYDSQQGWQAERQGLLAAAAGLGGTSSDPGVLLLYGAGGEASGDAAAAAAAGDLSESLQRLWLLVEATAQLQGSKDLLAGGYDGGASVGGCGGIDTLNAALLALFKVWCTCPTAVPHTGSWWPLFW